jgi:Co/Zn/Cd efflux system component
LKDDRHQHLGTVWTAALIGYLVLAVQEIAISRTGSRPALAFDGLHNGLEVGFISLTLWEHRRVHRGNERSSIPKWNAYGVIIVAFAALALALVDLVRSGSPEASLHAALLTACSFSLNLVVVDQTGHGYDRDQDEFHDPNEHGAWLHFVTDTLTSGGAGVVYILLLVGAPGWLDPLATIMVSSFAAALNISFILKYYGSGSSH